MQRDMENKPFNYQWFWRKRLPERKGQYCRVLVRGKMNSALVEFENGFKVITSRFAVRKRKEDEMDKKGLYGKYRIEKADGSVVDPKAIYFTLRIDTDPHARAAIRAYIESCREENPDLAGDLEKLLEEIED